MSATLALLVTIILFIIILILLVFVYGCSDQKGCGDL